MIMEMEIDFTKSAQENANDYYNKSKKLLQKREGAEKAIKELESRLKKIKAVEKTAPQRKMVKVVKREWYEKFHWLFTSTGMLAIGGRDAHQNELINSRYFEDSDLFFHADIFGAPVFVLKNGMEAPKAAREEVAEFAGCYSSAWKEGLRSIDVYAMKRSQVSKSSSKGSLGTGSFLLSGEREWYRNVQLLLFLFVKGEKVRAVSQSTFNRIKTEGMVYAEVTQGNFKKSDAAKKIAAKLGHKDIDEIMRCLPVGSFRVK